MSKQGRLVLASFLILLAACGGSQKPNPLPSEEPMDKSGGSDSTPTTTTTAASTDSAADPTSSSAADPSAGLGATDPTAAPTADATANDPKIKKGKGKGLPKADCDKMVDHELDIVVSSMGMDASMKAQLKAQAASDPNFTGLMTECMKSGSKAAYKCVMAAQSKSEIEKCDGK